MYKVKILPHWEVAHGGEPAFDTATLLSLLISIQADGSIAQAAQATGLSYRYAWGLLRDGERTFGHALIESGRGRGTTLTPFAEKLVWADRRIAARLSPLLESLASELGEELNKIAAVKMKPVRLQASHGFAVAALLNLVEEAGLPVTVSYRNSSDAVAALSRRECDLAGFHVPFGKFEQAAMARYTRWIDAKSHYLIHLAVRHQGLFVAPGNPKNITGLADLARRDVNFVNRQDGSGTRMLLELMLADAGLSAQHVSGFENAEFTHSAVAAYIASGMADVGLGVQTAAQRFGLDFIPLARERYFLAVHATALDEPLMQQLVAILQSPGYRTVVNELPGYDASHTGTILPLADAFAAAD